MELIFNTCGEFRVSPECPVSQIHSPLLHDGTPGIFSENNGAENNGKLPYLFILSKTATLVPEIAVENLPLGRYAALVPEFEMKDLPLGRTL